MSAADKKEAERRLLQWQQSFDYHDRDRDGVLLRADVMEPLKKVSPGGTVPVVEGKSEAQVLMGMEEAYDAENERRAKLTMKKADFLTHMEKWAEFVLKQEDLLDAWRMFDKEGRGQIRTPEVRQILTMIADKLNDAEIDPLLAMADPKTEGQTSYDDFVKRTVLAVEESKKPKLPSKVTAAQIKAFVDDATAKRAELLKPRLPPLPTGAAAAAAAAGGAKTAAKP